MINDAKGWNSKIRRVSKKRQALMDSGEFKPKRQKPIKQVSDKQKRAWDRCRSETIKFYGGKSVLSGKQATIVHHWEETRAQNPSRKYDLSNLVLLTEAEHKHTGADTRFYEIKEEIEYRVKAGTLILQGKENGAI